LIELTGGGVVADGTDADALAAALEPLLMDRKRLDALGKSARRAAEEHFTVHAMAVKVAEAFEELGRPDAAGLA